MSDTRVHECTFSKCDENGDDICNEDGSIKLFTGHRDFDWSHIAESVDDSDLVEFEDKHEITVVIEGGMCVDVRGLPEDWDYAIEDYDVEKQG